MGAAKEQTIKEDIQRYEDEQRTWALVSALSWDRIEHQYSVVALLPSLHHLAVARLLMIPSYCCGFSATGSAYLSLYYCSHPALSYSHHLVDVLS